jgi:hypothetical protein
MTESSTYRRAKYHEAKRLGLPLPANPPAGPSKKLSPEYRLALIRQNQRMGIAAPIFDRDGRQLPELASGQTAADAFLADHPGSFKRIDATSPTPAPAPVAAAPARPLSSFEKRVLYLADCRKFGGVHERMPVGTTWSPEISLGNLEK